MGINDCLRPGNGSQCKRYCHDGVARGTGRASSTDTRPWLEPAKQMFFGRWNGADHPDPGGGLLGCAGPRTDSQGSAGCVLAGTSSVASVLQPAISASASVDVCGCGDSAFGSGTVVEGDAALAPGMDGFVGFTVCLERRLVRRV